jgi:hypothetical protein
MPETERRLVALDAARSLNSFGDEPDVHGWEVIAADGSPVGSVSTLLAEPGSLKVRYVGITLDSALAGQVAHEPRILVPVGRARVDSGTRRVLLERLACSDVLELPAHIRTPPAPELETTLRRRFEPGFTGFALDRDFFESDLYDSRRFYGGSLQGRRVG